MLAQFENNNIPTTTKRGNELNRAGDKTNCSGSMMKPSDNNNDEKKTINSSLPIGGSGGSGDSKTATDTATAAVEAPAMTTGTSETISTVTNSTVTTEDSATALPTFDYASPLEQRRIWSTAGGSTFQTPSFQTPSVVQQQNQQQPERLGMLFPPLAPRLGSPDDDDGSVETETGVAGTTSSGNRASRRRANITSSSFSTSAAAPAAILPDSTSPIGSPCVDPGGTKKQKRQSSLFRRSLITRMDHEQRLRREEMERQLAEENDGALAAMVRSAAVAADVEEEMTASAAAAAAVAKSLSLCEGEEELIGNCREEPLRRGEAQMQLMLPMPPFDDDSHGFNEDGNVHEEEKNRRRVGNTHNFKRYGRAPSAAFVQLSEEEERLIRESAMALGFDEHQQEMFGESAFPTAAGGAVRHHPSLRIRPQPLPSPLARGDPYHHKGGGIPGGERCRRCWGLIVMNQEQQRQQHHQQFAVGAPSCPMGWQQFRREQNADGRSHGLRRDYCMCDRGSVRSQRGDDGDNEGVLIPRSNLDPNEVVQKWGFFSSPTSDRFVLQFPPRSGDDDTINDEDLMDMDDMAVEVHMMEEVQQEGVVTSSGIQEDIQQQHQERNNRSRCNSATLSSASSPSRASSTAGSGASGSNATLAYKPSKIVLRPKMKPRSTHSSSNDNNSSNSNNGAVDMLPPPPLCTSPLSSSSPTKRDDGIDAQQQQQERASTFTSHSASTAHVTNIKSAGIAPSFPTFTSEGRKDGGGRIRPAPLHLQRRTATNPPTTREESHRRWDDVTAVVNDDTKSSSSTFRHRRPPPIFFSSQPESVEVEAEKKVTTERQQQERPIKEQQEENSNEPSETMDPLLSLGSLSQEENKDSSRSDNNNRYPSGYFSFSSPPARGGTSFSARSPPAAAAAHAAQRVGRRLSAQVAMAVEAAARFGGRRPSAGGEGSENNHDRPQPNVLPGEPFLSPSALSESNFRTPTAETEKRNARARLRYRFQQRGLMGGGGSHWGNGGGGGGGGDEDDTGGHRQGHTMSGLLLPRLGSSSINQGVPTPKDDDWNDALHREGYNQSHQQQQHQRSSSAASAKAAVSSFFDMVMCNASCSGLRRNSGGDSTADFFDEGEMKLMASRVLPPPPLSSPAGAASSRRGSLSRREPSSPCDTSCRTSPRSFEEISRS